MALRIVAYHRYIAPEVARLKREREGEHDKAVDWWGMGILMHELLTGYTPFGGNPSGNLAQDVILRNILELELTVWRPLMTTSDGDCDDADGGRDDDL